MVMERTERSGGPERVDMGNPAAGLAACPAQRGCRRTSAIVSGGRLTPAAGAAGVAAMVDDPAATRYTVAARTGAPVTFSETVVADDSDSLASTTSISPVSECRAANAATCDAPEVAGRERSPNVAPRPSALR